ncbi:MAG: 16S rRNA (adenine(1518)-N(6)/adenine(1519)-N(6))-dimethyltransferase RsmA [Parvibaculales bacterium]
MADLDDDPLPPLRDIIHRYDLWADKSLGQNFILDLNVTRRIARSANITPQSHIIEIGPGPGGLTRALLMEGAGKVTVIERDRRFQEPLEEIAAHYAPRLEIIFADALEVYLHEVTQGPYQIVANLPYNLATPLLLGWLKQDPIGWQNLTLMFQKEVGERICATTGDKHYGRLGVISNFVAQTDILFDVKPEVFVPPPKVTSAIVQLTPRPKRISDVALDKLEIVTQAAFGQRRKMLRASLKQLTPEPQNWLTQAGIDETLRAENLTIEQFCALAETLPKNLKAGA